MKTIVWDSDLVNESSVTFSESCSREEERMLVMVRKTLDQNVEEASIAEFQKLNPCCERLTSLNFLVKTSLTKGKGLYVGVRERQN